MPFNLVMVAWLPTAVAVIPVRSFAFAARFTLTLVFKPLGLAEGCGFWARAFQLVREREGEVFFALALETVFETFFETVFEALDRARCVLFSFCADAGVARASTSATPSSVARVLEVFLNMMNLPS